jgi:hypothetical protein
MGFTVGRLALMATEAVGVVVRAVEVLLRVRFDPHGWKPRQEVCFSGFHGMARTTGLFEIVWMDGRGGIILSKDVVTGVTGVAVGSLTALVSRPMAIHLFVALIAVYGSAAGGIPVALVLDTLVAFLTSHRLATVHGTLEFSDHDLESAPFTALGVTSNAFFHRVGLSGMGPCDHQKEADHQEAGWEKNSKFQLKPHDPHRLFALPDA